VTDSSGFPLVLIVDDDLGFVMWLGEVFNELGCQPVPALHCREALELAEHLKLPITSVVINPGLPGAAPMLQALLVANPGLWVVLIRNPAVQALDIQARAILDRPSPWEPISRSEWLAKVRRVLFQASAGA
jgi:hypothetical protein